MPAAAAAAPKYSVLIAQAITALKERSGSSLPAIVKYIAANNKLTGNYKQFISAALKKGVTKGSLIKVKASYKVSKAAAAPKKPKAIKKKVAPKKTAAKAAAPKKTAAKKTAAKKTAAKAAAPKKTAAKKVVAKAAAPKKTVAKKVVAKAAAPKKTVAKKATGSKAAPKKN